MNMILNNNQPDFYPKRRQQQQQPNLRGAIEMWVTIIFFIIIIFKHEKWFSIFDA